LGLGNFVIFIPDAMTTCARHLPGGQCRFEYGMSSSLSLNGSFLPQNCHSKGKISPFFGTLSYKIKCLSWSDPSDQRPQSGSRPPNDPAYHYWLSPKI
jgi:hypothetical protein